MYVWFPSNPKYIKFMYGAPALLISWAVLTIAFGIRYLLFGFWQLLAWVALAVATGFIFHELAHRETAKRMGCRAEYVLWPTGLAIALFLALISKGSFVFAAPGAVTFACAYRNKRAEGLIAAAGPLANIAVALVSQALFYLTGAWGLLIVSNVNWFLALFNLLPLDPLDGAKVMRYNLALWLALFSVSVVFTFVL
ncbi:site-2 protease family protein [Ignicoccus hospitalis]|uniref:Peptidase M50 n=1 Tax=Ignicoccus hospitalis (strain KIN4/I / DSM 18386 / JCM 14125) TaxID=453591 RepID=A8A8P1_IGNH4|nr:site-2 protease family protein [Ignicoccus hospitalis]ABU81293.1 peptidase M50 [Ignicoccus hospitalis KIN4/I]HIH90403.1 site-2 protease family protein [Desulfurococcaceae archaeon]